MIHLIKKKKNSDHKNCFFVQVADFSYFQQFIFTTFYLFIFNFILFLNFVLVLTNIKMNPPQVYLCSPSWTLFPPPSPYPPSGWSQCTSPQHPVLCIEPGLATRFIHDIIHVSMPFSQISPPSPSSYRTFHFTTVINLPLYIVLYYFIDIFVVL